MKKLFSITAMLFLVQMLNCKIAAQHLSPDVQAVYDACMQMSIAVGAGDDEGLKTANKALKKCNTGLFGALRCLDDNPLSLDGHFVFDELFVDSLLENRDVYKFAQRYADKLRTIRGEIEDSRNKVLIKTCTVKASSSSKFSFVSRGHQELAVVSEPKGAITLRIYDKTHREWHNDKTDETSGRMSRHLIFDLPKEGRSSLELEVINTTQRDISFVIIKNAP